MRVWLGLSVITLAGFAPLVGCSSGGGGTGGAGGGTTSSTTTSSTSSTSSSSSTTTTGTGGAGGGGGLPAGKCRTSADCSGGAQCAPPGAVMPCGNCYNGASECATDADCTAQSATAICDPIPCACSGQTKCMEGCTADAACGPGQSCGADHRCAPKSCAQQLDCPTNFLCPPVNQSHCERRTCSVDAECDVGYCVAGACFDMPGTCTLPVP